MSRRASLGRMVMFFAAVAVVSACGRNTPEQHFAKASAYEEQSRWQEAIIEYRAGLQLDQKRGDMRFKLADVYLKTRDLGGAYQQVIRGADLLPNDATAQLKAGGMLLIAGQFEDAKTRAQKALAIDPKNAEAQIVLGNAMAGLKDMDAAISEYQDAIALDPNQSAAYGNIGTIQFVKGQRAEAEASFRKAIEVAPKSVQPRMALANFLWASARQPEAEQTLKDALALDATNVDANRALGSFYMMTNRAAEAEPFFKAIAKKVNTPAATMSLADYYVVSKRFSDARKLLRELAEKEENFAVATTRLAAVAATEGDRAGALSTVREVLLKYPKDRPARLLAARLLLADGKRDLALTEATTIVTEEPTSAVAPQAFMLIGTLQASMDRRQDAIKAFEEVLKRQRQPLAAAVALGNLHLSGGSFDKAATYAQQALAIQPKNPLARALMIRVYVAQGNHARASEDIASLQKDFPNAPVVWDLVASDQLLQKNMPAARASYTKAAELAPADLEAITGLVSMDVSSGRIKEALARIDNGLQVADPSARFLILAARTYAAAGNLAKTEDLLKRAIDASPSSLVAYSALGSFYISQKRLPDARNQFEIIVQRDPKSVSANTMLGMLMEAQHQLPDAERQYEKVLALDARAAVAANNLAWLYVASNRNLDQALQLAQTAQQQLPDEPHVNDTLGWIYYQKNMAPMAVRHLENSVQKDATDPSSIYHLGMAYARTGDLDKARTTLKRALAMKTSFDGADDAKKTLAQIGS